MKPAGEEYDRKDRRKIYPSDIKSVTLADESLVDTYKFCKEPKQPEHVTRVDVATATEITFEEEVKMEVAAQHVSHFYVFLKDFVHFSGWEYMILEDKRISP